MTDVIATVSAGLSARIGSFAAGAFESAFEAGAALRNPTEDVRHFASPAIIDRRVKIMCATMAWPRDRVLRWCFAQAVLSAIWSLEDGESPARGLAVADATRPLL